MKLSNVLPVILLGFCAMAAFNIYVMPIHEGVVFHKTRSASVVLTYTGESSASCGGTAIGPHAVLAAFHCQDDGHELVKVDNWPVRVRLRMLDDQDHAIYLVDGPRFSRWAEVTIRPLRYGETVHSWGSPDMFYFLFRDGTYAGEHVVSEWSDAFYPAARLQLFNYQSGPGDSGAGIFDSRGRVVAVESAFYHRGGLALVIAFPLGFTPWQLETARNFEPRQSAPWAIFP